jgi:excisionase family DNA binding protein
MSELLTTKQLLEILKIDRVTVYRMLNDGRLRGVKVGNQWRFPDTEIDRLLGNQPRETSIEIASETLLDIPVDCVQRVQEIFAGIIGVSALTVTPEGIRLTEISFPHAFCKLIQSSPAGCQGCQDSWKRIALRATGNSPFQVCHAGLSYIRAGVGTSGQPAAWLIAGQYYLGRLDPDKERERLGNLADKYDLPLGDLTNAAQEIPVLNHSQQDKVREWTPRVAHTIDAIICERSDLLGRFQKISELSTVRPVPSLDI